MREVVITYEGEPKTVKINSISYPAYNDILQKVIDTKLINTQTVGNANVMLMRRLVLEKSLVEKIDLNKVNVKDGIKLEDAAWEESGLGEDDATFPDTTVD